ncbi:MULTISPECIES: LuxR C-terminal-related transcriptional regulator [unclassified Streptomyces]|uniref:LuxR C-terminal-related transcriptional regulator n=1 Tax=unclassified Streptomyces TaxID=2593676 RepID=UPI000AF97721|nr:MULTISPECIES: LuxR C-terminal-related transcriptional regulator [unclassified Streptomyces]
MTTEQPVLPELPHQAVDVYQRILNGERLPADIPGLDALLSAGFVVPVLHSPGAYSAVDPRRVGPQLITLLQAHISAASVFADAMPSFLADLEKRFDSARPGAAGVERLTGLDEINKRINDEHHLTRSIIRSGQPGQRTPEDLRKSLKRDEAGLRRGLAMRTLYPASLRRTPTVSNWAQNMAGLGAEVRTLAAPFQRSIIFDDRTAFIPDHSGEGPPPPTVSVVVTEPLLVARIIAEFELDWARADTWYGAATADQGTVTTKGDRALLRELCSGKSRAEIADALSISPNWLGDRIRSLTKRLGLKSEAQLIHWWCRSPEYSIHD